MPLPVRGLAAARQVEQAKAVAVNITVGPTAFGTLVASMTLAEKPRYSIDNQTAIELVYRLATRKKGGRWLAIPNNHTASGEVLDIWEGQANAVFEIKIAEAADEDSRKFSLATIGTLTDW